MKKKSKIFLSFIIVFVFLAAIIIGGNIFAENKFETALRENLEEAEFEYDKLNVSLVGRSTSLTNPIYKKNGIQMAAEEIKLEGIAILDYLINKNIEISTLRITKPEVIIYTENQKEQDSAENGSSEKLDLLIKSVEIVDGSFKLAKNDSVKEVLFARFPNIDVREVRVDQESLESGLPFDYGQFHMNSDSLFFNMNDQHDIYVERIELDENSFNISEIRIIPLYDKQEFQEHIPYEKDRFEVTLNDLVFESFNWSFENDSLSLESKNASLSSGDIEAYRDKQVRDDPRIKPMYSKMFRELPFKLKIDTFKVENLAIQYEELVDAKRGPGKVTFKNLSASIYNISNVGMETEDFPRTNIDVQTQFMGEADLEVNWNFDISNKADLFSISGQMDRISSEGINQFMEPALNVKAKGGIRDMRFNFTGNNQNSTGDMKLEYKDFKIEVLQKDGEEKNKFLSAIANFFINKDAASEEKEQKDIETERTLTKSFWNYLWKNVRNGALKSFL